jgi:large subunit ribosomal protein L32
MPPLPKRKLSKGRRDRRRAHDALPHLQLVACPKCRQPRLPHHVCPSCGSYRGREVVDLGGG